MSNNPPNHKSKGTTVWVSPSTRDALKKKKRGGESFDEMIRRRFRI